MRGGGGERLAHRDPAGNTKRQLARIDAVEASVVEHHRDIDHRKTERSFGHGIAHPMLDRRDPLPRDRAAADPVVEPEPFARCQRPKLDHDIAELAMPARLFLVAAALGHRAPDRLAIADARRARPHLDSIAPLQPRQDGRQMLVVDTAQPHFVARLVMLEAQRRILLDQPRQRARQLDVILAVGGLDRQRDVTGRQFDVMGGCQLPDTDPLARLQPVDLGHRDNVAVVRFGHFAGRRALDREQGAQPSALAIARADIRSLADLAAQRARQSQPPDRSAMADLEGVERGVGHAQPPRGGGRPRRLMAQRLEQPANARPAAGRSEQHRNPQIVRCFPGQVGKDRRRLGRLVHQ